jgi:hypothetical protein
MGLFSSEEITYVGTSVSRMNDAAKYVSSAKTGVIKGIKRDESIPEHIIEDLINGVGFRAKKYYKFAERAYIFGLPKDTTVTQNGLNGPITSAVTAHLTTLEGSAVVPDYVFYGPPNYFHLSWKEIYTTYAYEPSNNELVQLSAVKGYKVNLTQIELLLSDEILASKAISCFYSLGLNGVITTVFGRTTVGLKITYTWTEPPVFPSITPTVYVESVVVTEDVQIGMLVPASEYYQTKYTITTTGEDKFYEYLVGSGNAALDAPVAFEYDTPGTYFPWLYFRFAAAEPTLGTPEYIASNKLAKKIGINYKKVVAAIHDTSTRPAADLAQIQSSLLYLAVPADGQTQLEQQYLYRFFEKHFTSFGGLTVTESLIDFNNTFVVSLIKESAIVIRDARFKIALSNLGVYKRTVTGSIGVVGTFGFAKGSLSYIGSTGNVDIPESLQASTWHVYRKQVTLTTYIEYEVVGLTAKYNVSGGYYATSGWTEDVTDPKDILLVPLDKSITDSLKPLDQEELYYNAIHIVNNSLTIVVKWYQTGIWQAIFQAVAIIALVNGFEAGLELLSALEAIAAESMVWAMEIVYDYLIQAGLAYLGTKLFVRALGPEFAFLVALIAAASGKLSTGSFTAFGETITADNLMALSSSLTKAVQERIQEKFTALSDEINKFYADYKKDMDSLDKLSKELGSATELSKVYASTEVGSNITPNQFYDLTLATNIGTHVYDFGGAKEIKLSLQPNNY